MEHNKRYKVTRRILDEIIKASDSRTVDTMDHKLAKAIEKAKVQLEVLDELTDDSLTMDLTAPGPKTIPTPHQGPNTITVPMPGQPQPIPCEPYIGSSSPWIKPTICEFTEAKDQNVWPPRQEIAPHLEPLQTGR
jgi:hypothetical protein